MLYFHKGDIADYGITPPEIKAIFYVLLLILNYVKINVLLLIVSIISIIIKNILNRNIFLMYIRISQYICAVQK